MCSDKQNFCSPISESYMKFKTQGKKHGVSALRKDLGYSRAKPLKLLLREIVLQILYVEWIPLTAQPSHVFSFSLIFCYFFFFNGCHI